jgi:hypothetical protein
MPGARKAAQVAGLLANYRTGRSRQLLSFATLVVVTFDRFAALTSANLQLKARIFVR